MAKNSTSSDQYLRKLLGLEALDENNLPPGLTPGKYADPTSYEVLKDYEKNPQYRKNYGDFTGAVGWDPEASDAVIYRGPEQDYLEDRYDSQRGFARFRHATGRLLGTTGTKFLSGVGFMGALGLETGKSFIDAFTSGDTFEGNAISRASNNWFSNVMGEAEEKIKNFFPIFEGRQYLEGNWLQKAMTSEFWWSDAVDGLAFAFSSYLPGGALAKANLGEKIALGVGKTSQSLSKIHPALKFLYKNPQTGVKLTQDLTGLGRKVDKFTSWAALTSSEALFEAKEVRDAIMNDPKLWQKYDAETIRKIAAEKAANTFALNMAFLAPSNLLEVSSIFNKTKWGTRELASRTNKDIIYDKVGQQFAETPMSGFSKFMKNPWTKLGKDIVSNAAAEGFYEENIQYLISTLNQYNAHKEDPQGVLANFGEMLKIAPSKMFGDISDEQAQSILLGAAIGAKSDIARNIPFLNKMFGGDGGVFTETRLEDTKKKSLIKELNSNQDLRTLDVYQREPAKKVSLKVEDGKFLIDIDGMQKEVVPEKDGGIPREFRDLAIAIGVDPATGGEGEIAAVSVDEDGNPIIDQTKLNDLVISHMRDAELEDYHNALSNHPEKNQAALNIIRNSKLARLAKKYFDNGMGAQLFDMIDDLANIDDQSLELFGVQAPLNKAQAIEESKKLLADLEEVYNSVERGIISTGRSDKTKERRDTAFDVGSRTVIIDSMISTMMKQASGALDKSYATLTNALENAGKKDFIADLKAMENRYQELWDSINNNPQIYGIESEERQEAEKLVFKLLDAYDYLGTLSSEAEARKEYLEEEYNQPTTNKGVIDIATPNYAAARKALTIVRSLAESRQELFNDWKGLTNLWTGAEYYNNNFNNRARKDGLKNFAPTLVLDNTITVSKYQAWEKRMISIFRLRKRLDQIHQEYLGKLVEEWRSGAVKFGDIIDYMLNNRVRIQPDKASANSSRASIDYFVQQLDTYQQAIIQTDKEIEKIDDSIKGANDILFMSDDLGFSDEEIENINNGIVEDEQKLEKLKEDKLKIIDELGSALTTDPAKLKETLEGFNKIDFFRLSDDGIRRTIADMFKEAAKATIEAFNNIDTYDDIDAINDSIDELENLKRIFTERPEVTSTPEFKDFMSEIDDLLSQLTKARDIVEAKLFDRNRQERRRINEENKRFFELLGINATNGEIVTTPTPLQRIIRDILGDETWNKIITSLQNHLNKSITDNNAKPDEEKQEEIIANDIYAEVIMEILRSTSDNNKALLLEAISNHRNAQLKIVAEQPAIKKQTIQNTVDSNIVVQLLDTAKTNPLRAFRGLLNKLGQQIVAQVVSGGLKGVPGYDRTKESLLYQFNQTQNFRELIDNSAKATSTRPTPDFTHDDVKNLAVSFYDLYILSLLETGIQTDVSTVAILSNELNNLQAEKKNKDDNKAFTFPASLSQRKSVYDILKFFGTPLKTGSKYANFMYLRGPAGSGKTNSVIRWVLKLIPGVKLANVISSGHNIDSAKNLGRSIGLENESIGIEQLTNDLLGNKISEDKKLIIVDEIGAVSTPQLGAFANAVQAHITEVRKKNPKYELRVIVMGDANQISADLSGFIGIEQGYYLLDPAKVLEGIQSVVDVSPLYMRFRSDNPSINNIQDIFIDNINKVTKATGTLNVLVDDVATTPQLIKGSFVDSNANSLLPILLNSLKVSPVRSRVIIVEDDNAINTWTNKLKAAGVPDGIVSILSATQVQGKTFDEAYVALPDSKAYATYLDYNQVLYTATSRAAEFLYLAYIDNAKNVSDLNMEAKVAKLKDSKNANFDSSITSVQEKIEILKELGLDFASTDIENDEDEETTEEEQEEQEATKQNKDNNEPPPPPTGGEPPVPPSSPLGPDEDNPTIADNDLDDETVNEIEPVEEGHETVEEELNELKRVEEIDDSSPKPDPKTQGKDTSRNFPLAYPNHNAFYPVEENGKVIFPGLNNIKEDTTVYIIKANTEVRDRTNQPSGYLAVMPVDNQPNRFILLGILSNEEAAIHKEILDKIPNPKDNIYNSEDIGDGNTVISIRDIDSETIKDNSLAVKYSASTSTGLKYRFATKVPGKPRPFNVSTVLKKWSDGMQQGSIIIDLEGNVIELNNNKFNSQPSTDNVRIGIATKGKKASAGKNFFARLGMPVMVISNVSRKGGSLFKGMADQFIPLTPRSLNKNIKFHYDRYIKPLEEFVAAIEKFHDLLDKENIDPEYRLGAKRTADSTISSTAFGEMITNLANIYYYKNEGKEIKDETYKNHYNKYDKLFGTDLRNSNAKDNILELARDIDVLVNGEYQKRDDSGNPVGKPRTRREGKGKAQVAMNAIARSNLWITDADTSTKDANYIMVLRDEKVSSTEKGEAARGKAAEGSKKSSVSGRKLLGHTSSNYGNDNVMPDIVKEYVRRANTSFLRRNGKPGVIPTDYNGRIMTLNQLKAMLSFDPVTGESLAKPGGGLRVPISKRWFQEESRNAFGRSISGIVKEGLVNLNDLFEDTFLGVTPTTINLDWSNHYKAEQARNKKSGKKKTSPETIETLEQERKDIQTQINSLEEEAKKLEKEKAKLTKEQEEYLKYQEEQPSVTETAVEPIQVIEPTNTESLEKAQEEVIEKVAELPAEEKKEVITDNGLIVTNVNPESESVTTTDVKKALEKTNETVIENTIIDSLSPEIVTEIAEENNVKESEVKALVTKEVKAALNNGGKVRKSLKTKLRNLVRKIVTFLMGGVLAITLYYNTGQLRAPAGTLREVPTSNIVEASFNTSTYTNVEFDGCQKFVNNQVASVIGDKNYTKLGLIGHAWTATGNMVRSGGGTFIYNAFNGYKKQEGLSKNQITVSIKNAITSTANQIDENSFREGDIVNLFYEGSVYTETAYNDGLDVYSSHAGIVKRASNGELVIEHNIHGRVIQDRITSVLNGKVNSIWGKMLVSAIARPNFTKLGITLQDDVRGYKDDNASDLGQTFLDILFRSKQQVLSLYPTVSSDEYDSIAKIAYGILGQESSFGTYGRARGKFGYLTDIAQIDAQALGIERNPSVGVTQIRLTTISKKARELFKINKSSDLLSLEKSAQATMDVLLDIYVNQIPSNLKQDYKELLPLGYSNRSQFKKGVAGDSTVYKNAYVRNINAVADRVDFKTAEDTQNEEAPLTPSILSSLGLLALLKRKRKGEAISNETLQAAYEENTKAIADINSRLININKQLTDLKTQLSRLDQKIESQKQTATIVDTPTSPIVDSIADEPLLGTATDITDLLASKQDTPSDLVGEVMGEKELTSLYKTYVKDTLWQQFRRWAYGLIGRTPQEKELFKIIDSAQLEAMAGKEAYGLYKEGMIYLEQVGDGKRSYSNILVHELAHKVLHNYLSEAERKAVLNDFARIYGLDGLTYRDVEEQLVKHIIQSKNKTKQVPWSTKIWWIIERFFQRIGFFNKAVKDLDGFITRFNNGYFRGTNLFESGVTMPASKIEKFFNNDPEAFIKAKKYILLTVKKLWDHETRKKLLEETNKAKGTNYTIDTNPPMSFLDAVEASYAFVEAAARAFESNDALREASKEFVPAIMAMAKSKKAFAEVTNHLFPGISLGEIYDLELNPADEELEVVNIYEQTVDRDLIDESRNLLKGVKQALSTIAYEEDGKTDYIPFGHAFLTMAEVLQSFNPGLSLTQLIDTANPNSWINLEFSRFPDNPKAKAIKQFVYNLILSAQPSSMKEDSNVKELNWVDFFNEDIVFIDRFKTDITDVQTGTLHNKSKEKNSPIRRYEREKQETHQKFLQRIIQSEGDIISSVELYEQLRLFRARNLYSQIITGIASLRFKDPMIGVREKVEEKRFIYKYFRGKEGGTKAVMYSNFAQGLVNRYYTSDIKESSDGQVYETVSRDTGQIFSYNEWNRFTDEAPLAITDDKERNKIMANRIADYLRAIGITNTKNLRITNNPEKDKDIPLLYQNMIHFNKRMREQVVIGRDEVRGKEKIKVRMNIEEFVQTSERRFLEEVARKISPLSNLYRPTNFIRGDGKRAYKWIAGSWIMDIFKHMIGRPSSPNRFSKGLNFDNHEFLKLKFFQRNIFNSLEETIHTGLNMIHEYVDHDSIKYKGLLGSTKLFKKETTFDWASRVFNYAFLGYMTQYTGGAPAYVQPADTISSKPQSIGAVVNVLRPDQLKMAIEQMIRQQLDRLEYANVQGYDKTKNFIYGLQWDGRSKLSDETIKKKVDEVYKALAEKADETLRQFLDEGVLMSGSVQDAYAILENNGFLPAGVNHKTLADQAVITALNKLRNTEDELSKLMEIDEAGTETDSQPISEERQKELDEAKEELIAQANKNMSIQDKNALYGYYKPLFEIYFLNNYVNSHQLRQLFMGDSAFYKTGKESYDLIKRISIAFGAGRKLLVGASRKHLPLKSKVAVIQDDKKYVEEIFGISPELIGESYTPTDGQGFITPKYWKKMRVSAGIDSELDVTLKPVYWQIDDTGVPRALKYSLIVLTDELIAKFPHLAKVRDAMDAKDIDMAVFESAVKVGIPKNLTKITDGKGNYINLENGVQVPYFNEIADDSVFELDNRFLRLQLNPAHDPYAATTNPSQLTFQPVTNMEINLQRHWELLQLNGDLIKMGAKKLQRLFKLRNGRPTGGTKNAIRNRGLEAWFDMGGYEALWGLLNNPNISLNLPALTSRLIPLVSSAFSRHSIKTKFRGSKLVLQSSFGTGEEIRDTNGNLIKVEELVWRTEEGGFTEMYVPEAWKEEFDLKEGMEFETPILAFRLPSTGMHSALRVKIKGFYPAPVGVKANIVIAPKEIVFNHGSDYDIDGLFVLLQKRPMDVIKTHQITEENKYLVGGKFLLKKLIQDAAPTVTIPKEIKDIEQDSYIPYNNTIKHTLEAVVESIKNETSALLTQSKTLKARGEELSAAEKQRLDQLTGKFGKEDSSLEFTIMRVYEASLQNRIVELFTSIIGDQGNREQMEYPITMDTLKKASEAEVEDSALDVVARMRGLKREDIAEKDYGKVRDELLYPKKDLSLLLDQRDIHRDVWSGATLTGAAANAFKTIAYIFLGAKDSVWVDQKGNTYTREDLKAKAKSINRAIKDYASEGIFLSPKEKEAPRLRSKYRVRLNGVDYDTLAHKERKAKLVKRTVKLSGLDVETEVEALELVDNEIVVGKTADGKLIKRTRSVWETLDSLVNAAIDNVKEQILHLVNLTISNSNQFFTLLGLGVPLNDVVRFFNQPVFLHLSKGGRYTGTDVNYLMENLLARWTNIDTDSFPELTTLHTLENEALDRNLNKEQKLQKANEIISLKDTIKRKADRILENPLLSVTSEEMESNTQFYYANSEDLSKLPGNIVKSQLIVLREFKKLTDIGERLFDASRASSILKQMPSDYASIVRITDTIESNISDIGTSNVTNEIKALIKEAKKKPEYKELKKKLKETEAYQKASKADKAIMTKQLIESTYGNRKEEEYKRKRQLKNKILSFDENDYSKPSEKWPFENSSLLSIPNWREAYKQLIRLKSMFQMVFFKHHRNIENFIMSVINRLNFKFIGRNDKYEFLEKAKNEFMHFLSTVVVLNIGGGEGWSMGIPPNESVRIATDYFQGEAVAWKTLYGLAAWTHKTTQFFTELTKYLNEIGKPNAFLDNLEYSWDKDSQMTKIIFTQDKMSDPIEAQIFKKAFLDLFSEDVQKFEANRGIQWPPGRKYSDTQLLLLKYLMLTSGSEYGRTSFSEVIPDEMYEQVSTALEAGIKKFIAPNVKGMDLSDADRKALLDEYGSTDVTKALERIKDQFLLQYAINNYGALPELRMTDSVETNVITDDGKFYTHIIPSPNAPLFVSYFDSIYYKAKQDSEKSYYVRVDFKKRGKIYFLDYSLLNKGYDLGKVFNGDYMIYNRGIKNGVFTTGEFNKQVPFKAGMNVRIKDVGDVGFIALVRGKITEVKEISENGKFKYELTLDRINWNDIIDSSKNENPVGHALEIPFIKIPGAIKRMFGTTSNAGFNLSNQINKKVTLRSRLEDIYTREGVDPLLKKWAKLLLGSLNDGQLDSLAIVKKSLSDTYNRFGFAEYNVDENNRPVDINSPYLITLGADALISQELYDMTVVHEALHVATMAAFHSIANNVSRGIANEEMLEIYNSIKQLLQNAQVEMYSKNMIAENSLDSLYLTTEHEFISGSFSDPSFAAKLKTVNVWDRILNLIKKLLSYIGFNTGQERTDIFSNLEPLMERFIKLAAVNEEGNRTTYMKLRQVRVGEIMDGLTLQTPKEAIDIQKKIEEKTSAINLTEDPVQNVYTSSVRTFNRLTAFVGEVFKTRTYTGKDEDRSKALAEKEFLSRNIPLDGTLIISPTEKYTFDQRVLYYERTFNEAASKGRILHKLIEYFLTKDLNRRVAIQAEITEEAKEVKDKDGNVIKQAVNLKKFKWLEKKIGYLVEESGLKVNLDDEIYDPALVDKIYPELMSYSEILGLATKIDGLVQHADGTLSILDWKTGRLLSDQYVNYVIKYGAPYGINDSKLNRAKLEVVFRMMIVKEMVPEAKFRNLSINWLNYTTDLSVIQIDPEPYLKLIADGLKATNPEAYQKLVQNKAFDLETYMAPNFKIEEWRAKLDKESPDKQLQLIDLELRSIRASHTDADIRNRKELRDRVSDLAKLRLQIESSEVVPLETQEQGMGDISAIERWTLNIKDAPSRFLQQFAKILEKRRAKYTDAVDKFQAEKEEKLMPVLKEYLQKNNMARLLSALTRDRLNYIPILGGLDKRDLYSFMWRYYDNENMKGWYANLKDTYLDANGVEVELTEAQKEFRNWYHKVKNETYERVLTQEVEDRNGKMSTIGTVQGIETTLYPEFMPRMRATDSEILQKESALGIPKKAWELMKVNTLRLFVEENDRGDFATGIPVKYAPAIDSEIIEGELHTFDVEKSLVGFTKQLLMKEQMDDAYVIAMGLKQYYADAVDAKGNLVYKNLTEFIEDHILLDVLQVMPQENVLTTSKRTMNITEKMADSVLGRQLGWKAGETIRWSPSKFFFLLKKFTSAAGMMLRPIGAIFNGTLIFFTNFMRATGGTMAKLNGVENVYYDLNTFAQAHIDWLAHLKHWVIGNDSKLEAIANKTRYLADNYDYFIMNKDLAVVKNKLWNAGNLYWFHTIFENYGAMTMLSAQLRSMQVKMEDGSLKSMWDLHDDQGNYIGPTRGVEIDQLGNKTEIKGLTPMEVGRLKRVYERAHGSYRQEERIAMELNVLGQWALQFKKYLPMLWRTNLGASREELYLGKYTLKLDENGAPVKADGMDVYTWEKTQTQGRIFLLGRIISHAISKSHDSAFYNKKNAFSEFTDAEKQDLYAFAANGLIIALALALVNFGIPPEDEEKYWAKRIKRLTEDLTLGLFPADLIRPLEKPFAPITKMLTLNDAVSDFFFRGIWGEKDSRGLPQGTYTIWRTFPISSSIHQWNSFTKSMEQSDLLVSDPELTGRRR